MKYKRDRKFSDEIQIACPGDVHIGSQNANKDAFHATVNYCLDNDCYMLLMGDLIDAIPPNDIRYDASNVDRECLTIGEQFSYIEDEVSRLNPGQLLGMVVGNHYGKWAVRACTDEKSRMCQRLGADFLGLHALYTVNMKNDKFVLSVWHGAGGGYQIGTTMNKLAQEPAKFMADVYLQGHSHNLFHFRKPLIADAEYEEDRQNLKLFCNTGCYLQTYKEDVGGYGESKGYAPQNIGFTLLKLKAGELPVANDMIWYHEKFHDENINVGINSFKDIKREAKKLTKDEKIELIQSLTNQLI